MSYESEILQKVARQDLEVKGFRVFAYGLNGVTPVVLAADSSGCLILSSLVPVAYNYISLGYTGSNLTSVVYKTGGSSGATVATLTLGYSGSTLISVART